jgi:large subunit ribosomal protein L7/L12
VSLTEEEVIRYLESLSGQELGALADEVLARLGVALPAAPEPSYMATMGAVQPEVVEMGIPLFEVVLHSHGADKLAVVGVVRRALGLEVSLAEAKRLVESAPTVIRDDFRRSEAMDLVEELRKAGAVAELG